MRDDGVAATRFGGHEQDHRIHAALREQQHLVEADERGFDAAVAERAYDFAIVDELHQTIVGRRQPATVLREEHQFTRRTRKGPDSKRRHRLRPAGCQPHDAHCRDRRSVHAYHG